MDIVAFLLWLAVFCGLYAGGWLLRQSWRYHWTVRRYMRPENQR